MKQSTPVNPQTAREEFIRLYKKNISRDGADELLGFLEKSDFFTAPASSRFHNSFEGGLCQHSINVYLALKAYYDSFMRVHFPEFTYTEENLAVAALLHDVCKIGNYKVDYRNAKNAEGVWEKVPYYAIADDELPYGHGEKSVYMISGFMKLTREEAMAIRWHMGFTEEGKLNLVGKAFEKYPLAFALSTADMNATYYMEV